MMRCRVTWLLATICAALVLAAGVSYIAQAVPVCQADGDSCGSCEAGASCSSCCGGACDNSLNTCCGKTADCSDGTSCSSGSQCSSGICEGTCCGQSADCNDGISCTSGSQCTNGVCDQNSHTCCGASDCSDGTSCGDDSQCSSGVCDPISGLCAAPTPTPTVTNTPTVTPTNTPTATPTRTPVPGAPVITGGYVGGSTTITGIGNDDGCTPGPIQVFDCGPDRICHDGDDFALPVVSASYSNGNFTIVLKTPLVPGQRIYVTDGCHDPILSGPVTVPYPAEAPLMSPGLIVVLVAALGLLGLTRLRWSL